METVFTELKTALESGGFSSYFLALFLSYIGGVLSSFTPCIYPMIPLTIGLIGGTAERSIKQGLSLSVAYVFGMSITYAALGVFASFSGKIFGSFTATTSWYLFIGILMIICSLWMMDVIKFDPNVLLSKISFQKKTKHHHQTHSTTFFGAFVLGFSSGFIAAPCTTPVLTTILSYIATQKSLLLGLTLMFSFAVGLGTILIVLGTFTGAMKILPKSGKWLQTVKLVSGLLILALGEYFVFKAGALQ